jgi:uncharacterized protein (TIGR02145 family)
MDFFARMMKLISENHLEEVFQALRAFSEGKKVGKEVILLEREYNKVKQDRLRNLISSNDADVQENKICRALFDLIERLEEHESQSGHVDLPAEAQTLLFEVSRDPNGCVRTYSTKDGWTVQSNNKVLFNGPDPRQRAQWKEAIAQLCEQKLLNRLKNSQKFSETYELTSEGYEVVESISDLPSFQDPRLGIFIDPRDNQEYPTIKLCDRTWLARNFNYEVGEGCCFYENDPKLGEKFGRLYSWDAAHRACPPGWRLPEFDDWEALVKYFKGGHGAYSALLDGGWSGFGALLGGCSAPDGEFDGLETWGGFWTSTARRDKLEEAWLFKFGRDPVISSNVNFKNYHYSIRLVKE